MATAGDLITAAFIKVGVDSPSAAQTASALISLNNMISLLGADNMPPVVTSESFTMVVGDAEYTIGDGAQWNTVRPMSVQNCFLRDSDNQDYSISIMSARDYNRMFEKDYSARPTQLYFLPEYTFAKIIFNTKTDVAYTAYFEFLKNFTEFAATSTTVNLPAEYKEFFIYNLAVSLAEDWDRQISKTVYANALRTKDVIESYNASTRPVPIARFDFGSGGTWDIESGSFISSGSTIDGGAF